MWKYADQIMQMAQRAANDARSKAVWDQSLQTLVVVVCLGLLIYLAYRITR